MSVTLNIIWHMCAWLFSADYVPKNCLVNFMMPGRIPEELKRLTRTEVSMVSICNPVMSVSVVSSSMQTYWKRYGCTIVKNVDEVAFKLPRNLPLSDMAVLRSPGSLSNDAPYHDMQFRPAAVLDAIRWLKMNNPVYANVDVDEQIFEDPYSASCQDVNTMAFDAEEVTDLDEALRDVDTGVSANPNA